MKKKKKTSTADTDNNKKVKGLDEAIGLAVKRLREYRGMTQMSLAEKAEVSQAWISLSERAGETEKNKRPSLKILQSIAIALGLPNLSYLIKFAEEMTEERKTLIDVNKFIAESK